MSDPRYDPRYQRDHDGEVLEPVAAESVPEAVGEPAAPGSVLVTEPSSQPTVEQDAEPVDAARRRNPWLALLWVLGAVLLALGLVPAFLYAAMARDISYQVSSGQEYLAVTMLPNLISAVSPWVVVAGIAAIVGAVFIHAKDWRG